MGLYLDGITWPAEIVEGSLKLTGDILNGDNSGRLQGSKAMYLEYSGTFYNYEFDIIRGRTCTDAVWDNLFRALTNPVNNHTMRLPFDQGTLRQTVYIAKVARTLRRQKDSGNKWEPTLAVQVVAMRAAWPAGGSLRGYTRGV